MAIAVPEASLLEAISDGSSPTIAEANATTPRKERKIIILMRATFFVHAREGVHLAKESDDPLEQYFLDSRDDEIYDEYFCGANWKKGCKYSRSTSHHKKPKLTPHKRVRLSTQRRDLKTKSNVQSNAQSRKENNERRLQERHLQRFGYEIYHRRTDSVGKRPTKMTAPNCYTPHKPRGHEDHPAALRYELKARDASDDLSRLLADLQHRDLTPEDYETLLRLDESVKPKTISESELASFQTLTLESVSTLVGELCSICMEVYSESQCVKTLPCQHTFHSGCIDTWLSSSSLNCPLDGVAVQS